MIILAAGQGSRLRPLTNDKPKCMVSYQNTPLIDTILTTAKECNLDNIAIIGGYKKEVLTQYLGNSYQFYFNKNYDSTNMVSTLFTAEEFMDDDIIISYSDIIYDPLILQKLINSKDDFSVVVDKKWKELWLQRMGNPLEDAETLKVNNGKITELGKKPSSYDDIEGQYIGLIKISKKVLKKVINFYNQLDKTMLYEGKDFNNMYMTTFIQLIIDNQLLNVSPLYINGGWVEIDTKDDLDAEII